MTTVTIDGQKFEFELIPWSPTAHKFQQEPLYVLKPIQKKQEWEVIQLDDWWSIRVDLWPDGIGKSIFSKPATKAIAEAIKALLEYINSDGKSATFDLEDKAEAARKARSDE